MMADATNELMAGKAGRREGIDFKYSILTVIPFSKKSIMRWLMNKRNNS